MSKRAYKLLSITDWLSAERPKVAPLVNGCQHYNKLNDALHQLIDEKLHKHCFMGPLSGTRLIIYTDQPSYATQLHFILKSMIAEIQNITRLPIRDIDVVVDPNRIEAQRPSKPKKPPRKSASGADNIAQTAKSLDGSPVGEALARLAKQVKK